jgi:hypothetical protein
MFGSEKGVNVNRFRVHVRPRSLGFGHAFSLVSVNFLSKIVEIRFRGIPGDNERIVIECKRDNGGDRRVLVISLYHRPRAGVSTYHQVVNLVLLVGPCCLWNSLHVLRETNLYLEGSCRPPVGHSVCEVCPTGSRLAKLSNACTVGIFSRSGARRACRSLMQYRYNYARYRCDRSTVNN